MAVHPQDAAHNHVHIGWHILVVGRPLLIQAAAAMAMRSGHIQQVLLSSASIAYLQV